jgi:hypothetical protein
MNRTTSITQVILKGVQDAGGALSIADIDRIALTAFKKRANKRRGVNVEVAEMVKQGQLRIGTDGLYRIPKTRKDAYPIHIGTTFYTLPPTTGTTWLDRPLPQGKTHRFED